MSFLDKGNLKETNLQLTPNYDKTTDKDKIMNIRWTLFEAI